MRHIGAWLLSTLIWLPYSRLLLAMDVHAMPVSSERLSSNAFVVAGWVSTGLFGSYVLSGRWRMVFRGIAHGLVFLVAFLFPFRWFAVVRAEVRYEDNDSRKVDFWLEAGEAWPNGNLSMLLLFPDR